uniref:Polysaccharide deacetylase family protein n=1 Tax=Roseihalotalea indica TaxID=2867963 RepID=A0AA49GS25_9BACT|nr:polysaccharide deacetylase family protein [Tunicatimonas sp. TK19036]
MKLLNLLALALLLLGRPVAGQIIKQPIPDKLVVLTFDDAVSTHATLVGPLLTEYGFGGTFFVCEFPPDFEDKTKYMSWEQIDELAEMGFEIANHTRTHTHVNQMNQPQLVKELTYIEQKCQELGIDKPVSFAYPAYDTDPDAFKTLAAQGYDFARIGGDQAYDPTKHHPYLIPSYSTTGTDKERVLNAIRQAREGKIVILTVHGVPDYAHDWVTTPPELFKEYLEYLHEHQYQVIALRDLRKYIDTEQARSQIKPEL